jgi:hypothetical protein
MVYGRYCVRKPCMERGNHDGARLVWCAGEADFSSAGVPVLGS